ncbi:MAG: NAD(P)/FAD-dependent oxidoreductase, partial [Frankiaceae bacterium]|nr:NAD(P)/FAD-dependent oxidoreductase [Frankiaceae bacterium]
MVDVTVVGSGPNGLAAALTCARAGLSVRVIEAEQQLGGGARTAELLEAGFHHDLCSGVHPMLVASPFFRWAGLDRSVPFTTPEISYAHPLPDGAALAWQDLRRTADGLGVDGPAWRRLLSPLIRRIDRVSAGTMDSPLHPGAATPTMARLGLAALRATAQPFRTEQARALLAGVSAHGIGARALPAALIGVTLAVQAHAGGWPIPHGGSQAITDALLDQLRARGVQFVTGHRVASLDELEGEAMLLSVTPAQLAALAGRRLPLSTRAQYRAFRHGPGVAKLDATLDGPIPWRDQRLARAGTVHLGGAAGEVRYSERSVAAGRMPARPFVLLAQQSMFDAARAPAGKHTLYAYAHVPNGHAGDATEAILRTIEEHAPGVRDLIRMTRLTTPAMLERHNPTYVGGDIAAGATTLRQLIARPRLSPRPWATGLPGVYLCGASTAPGPAVHGMAGHRAAQLALAQRFGIRPGMTGRARRRAIGAAGIGARLGRAAGGAARR